MRWPAVLTVAKGAFLAFAVVLTNRTLFHGADDYNHRFGWLTLAVWAATLPALAAVLLEHRHLVRIFWAFVVAASSAFAWGYFAVSHRELDINGILLMWDARNFGGNAAANHREQVNSAIVLGLLTWGVLSLPGKSWTPARWRMVSPLIPVLPLALVHLAVFQGAGWIPSGLPSQFSQAAQAMIVTVTNATLPEPKRTEPQWVPDAANASARKIVLLVDESVRPDYLDAVNPSGPTPGFAAMARDMIDFGPALSSSVCSSYSNAVLRFAAARDDLGGAISTSPLLFAFAKRAGYRTVYIDAQAHALKNSDLLQNFMTKTELAVIDNFYPLTSVSPDVADHRLADIVRREMASGDRVFIYANKQGAHFPYDINYPPAEARFHPTVTELGEKTFESNIASYRNAIAWNVDRFFDRLRRDADLADTFLIYTSDHGQSLDPTTIAHCAANHANPRMGLVPLFAYASDNEVKRRLGEGARKLQGRASHFQIVPSLLNAMGYSNQDVMARYGESLTEGSPHPAALTTGDIFGLFASRANWMTVDTNRSYVEAPLTPVQPGDTTATISGMRR